MELICIDLEASGLAAESYPIEIAWKNADTGEIDSFLINPDSASSWTYWDEHAEEMHGLDRRDLVEQGVDVQTACQRLNQKLADKVVVSDAPEFDYFWISRLFKTAGAKPEFKVLGLDQVLSKEQLIQFSFVAKAQVRRHRAMDDVEDILHCIQAVSESDL